MIVIISATILACAFGFIFNISLNEWLFIIIICGAISACEMMNSAVEATVDLVTTEIHPLAKIAKDTASSATLVLCITALATLVLCITALIGGIVIFLPKILALF